MLCPVTPAAPSRPGPATPAGAEADGKHQCSRTRSGLRPSQNVGFQPPPPDSTLRTLQVPSSVLTSAVFLTGFSHFVSQFPSGTRATPPGLFVTEPDPEASVPPPSKPLLAAAVEGEDPTARQGEKRLVMGLWMQESGGRGVCLPSARLVWMGALRSKGELVFQLLLPFPRGPESLLGPSLPPSLFLVVYKQPGAALHTHT